MNANVLREYTRSHQNTYYNLNENNLSISSMRTHGRSYLHMCTHSINIFTHTQGVIGGELYIIRLQKYNIAFANERTAKNEKSNTFTHTQREASTVEMCNETITK